MFQKKISELKRKVEKILAENQLEDVKVYPVDSIDYLLGRNTELYEQEKADHDISLKGQMLSQDEYLKRSGFGVFLAELFDFLQEDTRPKKFTYRYQRQVFCFNKFLIRGTTKRTRWFV